MKRLLLSIFFLLILTACSPSAAPLADLPTATTVPALPALTSTPSPSPTPEFPVRDGGTLHPGVVVISKDNLAQITELALWGRGVIKNVAWSEDGRQIIVDTSLSRYRYDAGSFQRVKEESLQATRPAISLVVDGFDINTRGFNVVVYDGDQIKGSFSVEQNFRGGWPILIYLPESDIIVVDRGAEVELRDGVSYEILHKLGGVDYIYDQAADGSYSLTSDRHSSLALAKDRSVMATGQFDGRVILRSGDGFAANTILETEGPVRFLSFSPDGTQLLSESNGSISVWDVSSGGVIGAISDTFLSGDFFFANPYYGTDAGLGVTVQENKIAYVNRNNVIILDLLDGKQSGLVDGTQGSLLDRQEDGKYGHPDYQPITNLFFSADGRSLFTVLEDRAYVWDVSSNQFIKSIARIKEKDHYGVVSVYSAPDNLLLVGDAFSSYIRIWNADDGSVLPGIKAWRPNSNQVQADGTHSLTISPDGKFVFSWSGLEGVASLWEIGTQNRVMSIKIPASEYSQYQPGFYPVALSPDNKKLLFTYSLDPASHIAVAYSIPDGQELYRILEYSAVFSPDGSIIAASVGNSGIRFYDAWTGKQLGNVISQSPGRDGFQLLYFSEDGKSLIAVSTYGTIGVWGIP
ncbi:MAG: WD40 repeat domain-containing protein [Chloroflexi bacterium]|nr:WD40 repeat domain-containing protein [Chloroflexota bacterium]